MVSSAWGSSTEDQAVPGRENSMSKAQRLSEHMFGTWEVAKGGENLGRKNRRSGMSLGQ